MANDKMMPQICAKATGWKGNRGRAGYPPVQAVLGGRSGLLAEQIRQFAASAPHRG